ncbi:unnamed protein product [Strongylus vulgaris]|uniref:Uncharacterized protein n=1 Tax=Strongylus vulgaris TaxID=40348 RepID=A0A3P7J0L4_STRVU|nr:unnamed protein product [Strongylus vulgaris]
MVRDPHHSNAAREKWRLAPLKTRRTLEVNRKLADPAVYVYMSKDEELSLSRYRRELLADPWLHEELLSQEEEPALAVRTAHNPSIIALPSDIDVFSSPYIEETGKDIQFFLTCNVVLSSSTSQKLEHQYS